MRAVPLINVYNCRTEGRTCRQADLSVAHKGHRDADDGIIGEHRDLKVIHLGQDSRRSIEKKMATIAAYDSLLAQSLTIRGLEHAPGVRQEKYNEELPDSS